MEATGEITDYKSHWAMIMLGTPIPSTFFFFCNYQVSVFRNNLQAMPPLQQYF